MHIRFATLDDAESILAVYKPYVVESAISFEYSLPTVTEFKSRMSEIGTKFPWLVGEVDGRVAGYAYASVYRNRCAYDWSVESTIYMDQEFHGRKFGKQLYQHLFTILKCQGVANVLAGITLPNSASVALHERMGFEKVAQIKDVGFKLGRWWDVGFWQLQLQKPEQPKPLAHVEHLTP